MAHVRGRANDTSGVERGPTRNNRFCVCVPPWLGRVCQTCHVFQYQCLHLIWAPPVLDGTQLYPTVPDGTRRYPTVPDGTRRYSTVLDGTRRESTVLDGTLSLCVILVTLDTLFALIIFTNQSTHPLPEVEIGLTFLDRGEKGAAPC
jgi:hypothetical protein